MLKVQVPQLQKVNPSLFEGFFYKFWPHYLRDDLNNDLNWGLLKNEFYYVGQSVSISVFSAFLRELFDAVNLGRMPDYAHVVVDLGIHYDTYEADNLGVDHGFTREEVESAIYCWIERYSFWLMNSDMILLITKAFSGVYQELRVVMEHHHVIGYWYEFYTTESRLWNASNFAIGIQDGDFEPVHYGPWQGATGGLFYQKMDVGFWEFFLSDGKMYLEDGATQIPVGQMTTMCRLNSDVGKVINY